MTDMGISIVGLGKLGLPMAACFASKGVRVAGIDTDAVKVGAVKNGNCMIFEPQLQELLQASRQYISATQDFAKAVLTSDVTFIVVPTPSEPDGGFSLRYVLSACEAIGQAIRNKRGFHLVVLTSTVMPGSTDGPVRSILETTSGKQCGKDFGLCYSPEFIALGSVIRDFLNPDFLLIGESESYSGEMLEALYRRVCDNSPAFTRMNFINAELAKLAVNTFVTTKITFANVLARMCEKLPGANVDVVTSALGLDSRIGPKYLKGAIGYGGPCFPRDNLAFAHVGRKIGVPALLTESTDKVNREEVYRLADLVVGKLPTSGVVGILGLAYKPNTEVTEESQGLLLAQVLSKRNVATISYDPAALKNVRELGDGAKLAESAAECIKASDVVVVTTPWEEFAHIPPDVLTRSSTPRVLIDCWRFLDPEKYESLIEYVPLGQFIDRSRKES